MKELLKNIALQLPYFGEYLERIEELRRQNVRYAAQLNALETEDKELINRLFRQNDELAASKSERESLARQVEAFKKRTWTTPIGTFLPQALDPGLTPDEKALVGRFNEMYYRLGQQGHFTYFVSWLGYSTLKCPLDLWMYQEMVCRLRPEVIVETGTASGGSALYLASVCELVGHGEVITIDIDGRPGEARPVHHRLSYLVGSSTEPAIIDELRGKLRGKRCSLIFLDSDHRMEHVLAELRLYQQFVPVGGYLVVEDTNINGHPAYPEFGPGPMEAVEAFLRENDAFEADPACERFLLTMNPRGYLRRVK